MQRLLLAFTLATSLLACTADDDDQVPIDAPAGDDGSTPDGAGPDGATGPDAATACVLPTAPITCTDNSQCTSQCATAYCYNFNQVGMRCTMACTAAGNECPAGWSCNGMGRCRPPG